MRTSTKRGINWVDKKLRKIEQLLNEEELADMLAFLASIKEDLK